MRGLLAVVTAAYLLCSASSAQVFSLWPGAAPGLKSPPAAEEASSDGSSFSAVSKPTLTAFYAAKPNGVAVIVLPGGGYNKLVYKKEGEDVALRFNQLGIDAYVLKYRLPTESFNPVTSAFQDGQRAIRLLRAGVIGADRHTDPRKIGVIGFSAGGHLAAVLGTYYARSFYDAVDSSDALSARPNFLILGYPAVIPNHVIRDSLGRGMPRAISDYPLEPLIDAKTPATFIVHGAEDRKVSPAFAAEFAKALSAAKVPVEMHIFPGQPHGFAVRPDAPDWVPLCAAWLEKGGILKAAAP